MVSVFIDYWLWRRGNLSERMAAAVLVLRFPVVCVLLGVISGVPFALILIIALVTLIPLPLVYPFALAVFEDLGQHRRSG